MRIRRNIYHISFRVTWVTCCNIHYIEMFYQRKIKSYFHLHKKYDVFLLTDHLGVSLGAWHLILFLLMLLLLFENNHSIIYWWLWTLKLPHISKKNWEVKFEWTFISLLSSEIIMLATWNIQCAMLIQEQTCSLNILYSLEPWQAVTSVTVGDIVMHFMLKFSFPSQMMPALCLVCELCSVSDGHTFVTLSYYLFSSLISIFFLIVTFSY